MSKQNHMRFLEILKISIKDEIHKKIDAIVYKYLDFSTDEQKYIENQLVAAVKRRTEKSKTSGKC